MLPVPFRACGCHRAVVGGSVSPFAEEHMGALLIPSEVPSCEAAGPRAGSGRPQRALSHGGQRVATEGSEQGTGHAGF